MEITVNVTDVDINSVVGSTRRYNHDTEEYHEEPLTLGEAIIDRVADLLVQTSDRELRLAVNQVRTQEIKDQVAKQVEAALVEPLRQTNTWGEPTGEPTNLRNEILRIASKAVELPARSNSYQAEKSVLQRIISEEVDRVLAKELADVVKAEKEKVVAAVRAKAADLIATAVREGVGR